MITVTQAVSSRCTTKAFFVGVIAAIVLSRIGPVGFSVAAGSSTYPLINTLPTAIDLATVRPQTTQTHVAVVPSARSPKGSLAVSGVLTVLAQNPALVSAFDQAYGGRGAIVAYRFAFSGAGGLSRLTTLLSQ